MASCSIRELAQQATLEDADSSWSLVWCRSIETLGSVNQVSAVTVVCALTQGADSECFLLGALGSPSRRLPFVIVTWTCPFRSGLSLGGHSVLQRRLPFVTLQSWTS